MKIINYKIYLYQSNNFFNCSRELNSVGKDNA